MLSDQELRDYYESMSAGFAKAMSDVLWDFTQSKKTMPDEVQIHLNSARTISRVKTIDSFIRKCRRESVETIEELPEKIEDLLGIRIATTNKKAALSIFEYLQHCSSPDKWFCNVDVKPNCTPYTVESKNKYALRTGYQAYHITFVSKRDYPAYGPANEWPVEIQIMSRLWEFWAEYSREYFYLGDGTGAANYLPYNVAISKILDSADDLMTITIDQIRQNEQVEESEKVETGDEDSVNSRIGLPSTSEWFKENISKYFGQARVPNDFFLSKIAEELNLYSISLSDLNNILADKEIEVTFRTILRRSLLTYLPPYEQIFMKILLHLGRDETTVIEEVNLELRRLGIVLYPITYPR